MEGGISKLRSVLSWADEVEEEEAAAVQSDLQQNQKPNPFGSARPREVVLHEKGIDWRKLDSDLYRPPRLRDGSPAPQRVFLFTPQEQIPLTFVPPLRYPPKIIVGRILETGETDRLSIFANGLQACRCQSPPMSEKENRFDESVGQNSQHSKSLSPKSQQADAQVCCISEQGGEI
ncbi:uncharacterized protein LOC110819520 [Carica papaya]|uniref:uncharacterized protein LOC110819520 n=1 Tax=Carica papaya TaxID=3649 RepID=UPI000B8CBEC1|nr:uncharacterized protein LOC110819520 [Carica papaya]